MKFIKQLFCNHNYKHLVDYYIIKSATARVQYLEFIMIHKCDKCGKIKKTKRHSKFTMFDIGELVIQAERDGFVDEWTAIKQYGI